MNVQTQIDTTSPRTTEHFDVLIVGAGISGVGGAYHLTHAMPGHQLRRAGNAGDASAAPGARTAIPGIRSDSDLYTFGYRFKPWTGAPIATAAEILQLHGRGDRRERPRPPHPLPPPDHSARWSSEDNLWTIEATRDRYRRDGPLHRQLPLDVPGLLPPLRGLHAGMARHGQLQGPHRPSADLAGGSRLQGQERRRHRLGRDGGDADPGDRGRLRARHDAAALADLFPHRPQRDRDRRRAARAAGRRGVDPRDRAPQDPVRAGRVHQRCVRRAGEGEAGAARRGRAPISAPTTTSTRISRRATGPGGSASPSCRMATCSRASARARHRSSPTRSSASPRPASC